MKGTGSLYYQVMEKIRQKIMSGEYPLNSKLPNEFELSDLFGVSRVTLRKAIKGLVDDGLVEKIQGVGTFVRKPQKIRRIIKSSFVESFSKTAQDEGFEVSAKVIELKKILTPEALRPILNTTQTLYTKRVHLVGGDPVMLEENYFPLPRFSGLEKVDLTQSLYGELHQKFKIKKLTSSDIVITIAAADREVADNLKKSLGFPLLLLKVIVNDEKGNIVHAGKQYIVSDRYEFHI